MKDYTISIARKNGIYQVQSENAGIEEMVGTCGYLETQIGLEAIRNGMDLETVKTKMLDIHLNAMSDMERVLQKLSK